MIDFRSSETELALQEIIDFTQLAAAHLGGILPLRASVTDTLDRPRAGATLELTSPTGGTFATQENFRIIRRALDEAILRRAAAGTAGAAADFAGATGVLTAADAGIVLASGPAEVF